MAARVTRGDRRAGHAELARGGDSEVPAAAGDPSRDATNQKGRRTRRPERRLLRDRRPPVPAADPAAGLPATTVWGYGSVNHPGLVQLPRLHDRGAVADRPVRVKWINELIDGDGDFLPHLLPVDPTLHWANPPGGTDGTGQRPTFASTPGPYTGPVPIVTHLHGGEHTPRRATAIPRPGTCPPRSNIPTGFATIGHLLRRLQGQVRRPLGAGWEPGTAVFQYPNDQRAATLWFHDHTLGMTRLNVYAGPAGFYLLRGGAERPAERRAPRARARARRPAGHALLRDPARHPGPLVQRRRLAVLPGQPRVLRRLRRARTSRDSDVSPIWNPEFFGNTMVVNGRTWPFLEVEPRRYRFRLLNGCNSPFLILKIASTRPTPAPRCPSGRSAPRAASCRRRCSSTSC